MHQMAELEVQREEGDATSGNYPEETWQTWMTRRAGRGRDLG
jgi:hypothetical protein